MALTRFGASQREVVSEHFPLMQVQRNMVREYLHLWPNYRNMLYPVNNYRNQCIESCVRRAAVTPVKTCCSP